MAGLSAKANTAARTTAGFVSFHNQLVIIVLILFWKQDPASGDYLLIERTHEINKVELLGLAVGKLPLVRRRSVTPRSVLGLGSGFVLTGWLRANMRP
jgi:hypothetical protein